MNICHVFSTFIPTTSGGVEKHISTLSKGIASLGHNSMLLIPRRDSLKKHVIVNGELEIFRLGIGTPTILSSKRFIGTLLNLFSNDLDFSIRAWVWIHDKNNLKKIDLIHVHSDGIGLFGYSLRNGQRLQKWTKKPLVVTIHQKIGNKKGDILPRSKKFFNFLNEANKIIVHRQQNVRILNNWGYANKTVFIPIPIDVKSYRKPKTLIYSSRKLKVLYVGRLDHRRGIIPTIKALYSVYKINKNVELHIVGYGSLEKQARELSQHLGLEKVVFFHGKQFDVRKYLWNSDIYISLNISDNYPSLALREAMAAGLVPVVTNVGETKEIIKNNINGLLVHPFDSDAISTAILTLLKNENLRKRLSLNATLSTKAFDIEHQNELFIDVYKRTLCEKS